MPDSTATRIAEVYRHESRQILATLIRLLGDIDLAEEALQEAFRAALTAWPQDGVPRNPRAWLVSTGRFKGVDAIRRRVRGRELLDQEGWEATPPYALPDEWDGEVLEDDQLRLIFTCCHPALPVDSRIALSLRTLCGLTTEEIARSFLVPVETMKKRISRAKATIRQKRLPYEVPSRSDLPERLNAVLHVVYLVYNEAHVATAGPQHLRRDVASQAVLLSRLVVDLTPEPEATGLLALLLLHESRVEARTDAEGDLVPLEYQDRSLWDRALVQEGVELVRRATASGRLGSYTIQAAIASTHAVAESVESTDWDRIVEYYDLLLRLQDSPIVKLHRAIAVGMRDGPDRGLAIVEDLLRAGRVSHDHRAHAVHAELALRAGATERARESYRRALELVRQEPEKRYLERRLAGLG